MQTRGLGRWALVLGRLGADPGLGVGEAQASFAFVSKDEVLGDLPAPRQPAACPSLPCEQSVWTLRARPGQRVQGPLSGRLTRGA